MITTMTTKEQLENQVNTIADHLTNWEDYKEEQLKEGAEDDYGVALDWLEDALDIRYIVNKERGFISAQVLVAYGGPNIWVNFDTHTVEGYWGADSAEAHFTDNGHIESALQELWEVN